MGVRATNNNNVALYDSTTGMAFGPVFESTDDALDFLEWLREKYSKSKTFQFGTETLLFIEDPRVYRETELVEVVNLWKRETSEHGS